MECFVYVILSPPCELNTLQIKKKTNKKQPHLCAAFREKKQTLQSKKTQPNTRFQEKNIG